MLPAGFDSFANSDLLAAVGGTPFADELTASGATPSESMAITLRAELPGDVEETTGDEDGSSLVWEAPLDGSTTEVAATAVQRPPGGGWATALATVALVLLVAWVVVATAFIVSVARARSRRRRQGARSQPGVRAAARAPSAAVPWSTSATGCVGGHRNDARTRVPASIAEVTSSRPPTAPSRSTRFCRPVPARSASRVEASSVVADGEVQLGPAGLEPQVDARPFARVLGGVLQRFRATEVHRALHLRPEALLGSHIDRRVARKGGDGMSERSGEAAFGQPRRVHTVGEPAELADRDVDLVANRVEIPAGVRIERRRAPANQGQAHRNPEQRLLGAVVQITFDPAALVVGCGDDPRVRHPQGHDVVGQHHPRWSRR